jgi:hypothetical protein
MRVSPFSLSSKLGTADSGARSDTLRCRTGRRCGGELERIPVLDVGTGVGYLRRAWWLLLEMPLLPPPTLIPFLPVMPSPCAWLSKPVFWRLSGRGSPGDEESGSNGGRRDGAGRLEPAMEEDGERHGFGSGSCGSVVLDACFGCGVEAMAVLCGHENTFPNDTNGVRKG